MITKEKLLQVLQNPNFLTLFRMGTVPVIILLLLVPNKLTCFLAALFFSAAAITDYLDGFFARRMGLESNLGKIMDPIADKLLVSSTFIMMASLHWIPAWLVCIFIGREMAVTGLRCVIAENRQDVSASKLGKYKRGFQIAAIIPLLIHYSYLGINFNGIGEFFLWGGLIFSVWSGADYFFRFRKLIEL